MGHNYYGEPAWPNDILYIFPVVILGFISCLFEFSFSEPINLGEPANPFATPLEILPEWYFYPTFNLLRILPDKYIGVLSMAFVPLILLLCPFFENISKYQNPYRHSILTSIFIFLVMLSFWLGTGSLLLLSEALPLI